MRLKAAVQLHEELHEIFIVSTNPLSAKVTEPFADSRRPHKDSRVSAVAKLISSNRIQSPFFMARTNAP